MEGALSDILWADEDEPLAVSLRLGLRRSLGLGLLAGAGEFVSVCATTALDLGFDEALILGGASLLTAVMLSTLFAGCLVWPVRRLGAATLDRMHARLLGAVGGALVAWHLWPFV